MQKDLKDSIKARLYDFKYTPFLSAYIFSWIYFNSKLILIFLAPKLTVEKKIDMLSWSQVNYEYPIYFALVYVFVFPLATALFYATTLFYKALMNWIQQKIQDKTPLPQEQANAIREENFKLTLEHREVMEKIEKIQLEYSSKEKTLISQFSDKEKTLKNDFQQKELNFEEKLKEKVNIKVEKLNAEIDKKNEDINYKNNQLKEQQETITSLMHKISNLESKLAIYTPVTNELPIIDRAYKKAKASNDNLINTLTKDQIKALATFYNNDSGIYISTFKDYINKEYKVSRTLVEARIRELSVIDLTRVENRQYILTKKGQEILEKLFT